MSEREEEDHQKEKDKDSNPCEQGGQQAPGAQHVEAEDRSAVIEKGRARLIVSATDQSPPEASEPREIRPQPRVDVSAKAKASVVDDPRDNVTRLERSVNPGKERIKVGKAKFEKLENRPSEDERQEDQWGQSLGGGWRMLFAAGGVVIIVVIGLVMMRGVLDGDTVKAEDLIVPSIGEKEEDPYAGSPEKWFRDQSGKISNEALLVLKGFVEASDDKARSRWVRRPEQYLKLSPDWPVIIDPLLMAQDKQDWDIGHAEDTGYLVLEARNRDYLPFRAYFTRDGESLKFDWQASTAWSDVSLQEIRLVNMKRGGPVNETQRKAGVVASSQLSPRTKSTLPAEIYTQSVLVRCMIRKKEVFYAGRYNDQEHSVYMLLSPDKMHHMWGYTAKGSDLDRQLRKLLDYGSFVVTLKKDKRVTLRVKVNEKDTFPSQLELVELVHPEWITP